MHTMTGVYATCFYSVTLVGVRNDIEEVELNDTLYLNKITSVGVYRATPTPPNFCCGRANVSTFLIFCYMRMSDFKFISQNRSLVNKGHHSPYQAVQAHVTYTYFS